MFFISLAVMTKATTFSPSPSQLETKTREELYQNWLEVYIAVSKWVLKNLGF